MSLIRFEKVSKTYGSGGIPVNALSNVDLEIKPGGFVCVAGPSGSGKTTLLNLMGGIDVPTEGIIYINGESVAGLSRTEAAAMRLKNMGFVFQSFNLIPVLTAYENVEYVLLLKGLSSSECKRRVMEVLDSVELNKEAMKRPGELSGGQQQRVAVARAIVSAPPIVLADEPTGNLDSKSGENLIKVFRTLNSEQKIAFVFSSHDPLIISNAERVVTLKDGRIV